MSLKQQLKKVRNLIAKGWCRDNWHKKIRGKDHYCIMGARNQVDKNRCNVLYSKINEIFDGCAIGFNDECKDKRVILRRLDKAIKEL